MFKEIFGIYRRGKSRVKTRRSEGKSKGDKKGWQMRTSEANKQMWKNNLYCICFVSDMKQSRLSWVVYVYEDTSRW